MFICLSLLNILFLIIVFIIPFFVKRCYAFFAVKKFLRGLKYYFLHPGPFTQKVGPGELLILNQ